MRTTQWSSSLKILGLGLTTLLLANCSHTSRMSELPQDDNVKVSREDADKDCKFIGKLEGRSMSKTPQQDEALKDLRQEAANKGANYLVVKQYSDMGTSATGLAYLCP